MTDSLPFARKLFLSVDATKAGHERVGLRTSVGATLVLVTAVRKLVSGSARICASDALRDRANLCALLYIW